VLGKLGDSRAVGPLIACLGDDPRKPKFLRRKPDFLLQDVARSLGELGDSRAVEPLIAAYAASASEHSISDPLHGEVRTADSCLSALRSVLAHSLASIDANLLRGVTTLPVLTWFVSVPDYEHPSNTEYDEYSSDPHEVRQLARQELIRRGLDA